MSASQDRSTEQAPASAPPRVSLEEALARLRPSTAMLDDAAELVALAACSFQESVRLHVEATYAIQVGAKLPALDNVYALVLHDMLLGRELLPGSETSPVPPSAESVASSPPSPVADETRRLDPDATDLQDSPESAGEPARQDLQAADCESQANSLPATDSVEGGTDDDRRARFDTAIERLEAGGLVSEEVL